MPLLLMDWNPIFSFPPPEKYNLTFGPMGRHRPRNEHTQHAMKLI
jgi:hypothetical protein